MVALSGCLVSYRDYRSDREDLSITGNKGCLKGKCEKHERVPSYDLPNKRLTNVLEVELGGHKNRPITATKASEKPAAKTEYAAVEVAEKPVAEPVVDQDDVAYENDLRSAKAIAAAKKNAAAEIAEDTSVSTETAAVAATACTGDITEHVVAAGETLQKISMKYYGTTKNYPAIFEANKDKLKTLNSVRVGQKLKIPCK